MLYIPKSTILSLSEGCKRSALNVKQLHSQLIINGVRSPFFFSKVIEYYCLWSSKNANHHAFKVFIHFHRSHIFLFNTLIRCVNPRMSISIFFRWFYKEELKFDEFTYTYTLGACVRSTPLSTLFEGRQIHTQAFKRDILSHIFLKTTTLHFYASNHDVRSARLLFDEIFPRSIITWNAIISGYCANKEGNKNYSTSALLLFNEMLAGDGQTKPSDTTVVCVISTASHLGVLETGICLHGYTEKAFNEPEKDMFIGTSLIGMYSKCGCLSVSLSIFHGMNERSVLTWTAMITGLAFHGKGSETMKLMKDMKAAGVRPNSITFTSLLSACCHSGLVEDGILLFNNMDEYGITPQIRHYGCVVDLLGRAGCLEEAYDFIMCTPMRCNPVLWRALLSACRVHGDILMGEKVGTLLVKYQSQKNPRPLAGGIILSEGDYVALSNVYASVDKWDHVDVIRRMMKSKDTGNITGCSSV